MKNPINRIKESFAKIREWLNLWKRVRELEKEMGKVLDQLKVMNQKLDGIDEINNNVREIRDVLISKEFKRAIRVTLGNADAVKKLETLEPKKSGKTDTE